MSIAEKTQTVARDPDVQSIAFTRDGKPVIEHHADIMSGFVWAAIDKAFAYSNNNKDSIPPGQSLYDFIKDEVKKSELSPEQKQLCLESCKLWGAYIGEPIETQSLKFFNLEECIDGSKLYRSSLYKCFSHTDR